MSVETSAVQISINVVDANSAAATAAVEQKDRRGWDRDWSESEAGI